MKRTPIPFSENEAHEIQARLDAKLDASHLSYRPAAQGTVAYLEGWKAIGLANEVFGFNGWSSEILNFTTDFTEVDANGKISIGISCMVRIHLKDGSYHEDIGYGSADNQKSKSSAYEKAKKEAATDATKRALRMFGNRLGNCAYDKAFLRDVKNQAVGTRSGNTVGLANYPKPQVQTHVNVNIPVNEVNYPRPAPAVHQPIQAIAAPPVDSPMTLFDESIFDNSMMISEEDLICTDENFANESGTNIYPILPFKRK